MAVLLRGRIRIPIVIHYVGKDSPILDLNSCRPQSAIWLIQRDQRRIHAGPTYALLCPRNSHTRLRGKPLTVCSWEHVGLRIYPRGSSLILDFGFLYAKGEGEVNPLSLKGCLLLQFVIKD